MTRAQIAATAHNRVTVTEDTPLGRETTHYYAPSAGGYVRIDDVAGRRPQVCDGLASRGSTLMWSGHRPLIDLIRRERRAAIAAERRYLARM